MPRPETRPSDPRHPYYVSPRDEQAARPPRDVRDFLDECDAFRTHVHAARVLEAFQ